VVYKIILNGPDREEKLIDTPAKLPDPSTFCEIQEPYVSVSQRNSVPRSIQTLIHFS
jgi:translation elongation factor EF-4